MSTNKVIVMPKTRSFEDLIDDIEGLTEIDRALFSEIYDNAVSDREASKALFSDLWDHIKDSASPKDANHVMHSQALTRYLERNHRSNEQLIKLSELVADARKSADEIDADSLLEQIKGSSES